MHFSENCGQTAKAHESSSSVGPRFGALKMTTTQQNAAYVVVSQSSPASSVVDVINTMLLVQHEKQYQPPR